jgi:DNA polymerase-3 subunit epsilon
VSLFDYPLVCIDVETDGANFARGHVLEIAAIRIEHGKIVDSFSTLLNPGVEVPRFITGLTGITTADLKGKPQFDDIAERLLEIMDGAIFVAHNVRFDYSFIKEEFRRVGINFNPRMLCTVRLSRALFPDIKGHKLSNLIERHNLSYTSRHRAYDDAHVLWQFLTFAVSNFPSDVLDKAIARQMALPSLPKNLREQDVRMLPEAPGVYIFEDEEGAPLYVGKSINIKRRVMSHFTRDTAEYREFKMAQNVYSIKHETTGGELSALLLESKLVKELKPLYNRKLRRTRQFIVAFSEKDERGYIQLVFKQLSDIAPEQFSNIMGIYQKKTKAKAAVLSAVRTFTLCPKLCGIEKANGACFSYQLKRCYGACINKEEPSHYNNRLRLAFERTRVESWPYGSPVLVSEMANVNEGLVVDQWRIMGRFSRVSGKLQVADYEAVFDIDAYKILKAFMRQSSSQLIIQPATLI